MSLFDINILTTSLDRRLDPADFGLAIPYDSVAAPFLCKGSLRHSRQIYYYPDLHLEEGKITASQTISCFQRSTKSLGILLDLLKPLSLMLRSLQMRFHVHVWICNLLVSVSASDQPDLSAYLS